MEWCIDRHSDGAALLRRAGGWLLDREAEHNLLLSLGEAPAEAGDLPFYGATVEGAEGVAGCAFRTPPLKLALTRLPEAAIPPLVRDVRTAYDTLPAVMGPELESAAFAAHWSDLTGCESALAMHQRIYELHRVIPSPRTPNGWPRLAEQADVPLVASWIEAFSKEAHMLTSPSAALATRKVSAGEVLLWEAGEPRSMAVVSGETPNGARIGYVYTPPALRGRGYASACVAALSQSVLESGRRFCCLYADLAHPTSNSIYARMGYRPVADIVDYAFGEPSRGSTSEW
jgi:GNAT superfamily N-acetyltransferase